jgi:zinc transporter 2
MFIEIIGGYIANSISIMSNAAHLLSDLVSFAISMLSVILSMKKPSEKHTYGYARAGILGALTSIVVIWILTIWLFYVAVVRIINKPEVNGKIMLIVAVIGLVFNCIMAKMLHGGAGHSHGDGGHGHSHGDERHGGPGGHDDNGEEDEGFSVELLGS